jgi:hypothetical protein
MARYGNRLALALRHVEEGQTRVVLQQQLIARLEIEGQPTKQAEEILSTFETTLLGLRNHLEIMRELMKPRR